MIDSQRKKIFTVVGLVASLAIGTFIFIQLQNIQPSNQQLQNNLNESAKNIDTQPISNQLNLLTDRVNVDSYNVFETQQLDSEHSLLEINRFDRETLAFARIESLQPILEQNDLFDSSTGYYIINYKSGRVFFIGHGLATDLAEFASGDQTVWVFGMTNYLDTYKVYSFDQKFTAISSYQLPENESLQSIDLTQQNILTATYKNSIENTEQSTYSNIYTLGDLKLESTSQISNEKTVNIPLANIEAAPDGT
jgi:hypothetical protein